MLQGSGRDLNQAQGQAQGIAENMSSLNLSEGRMRAGEFGFNNFDNVKSITSFFKTYLEIFFVVDHVESLLLIIDKLSSEN